MKEQERYILRPLSSSGVSAVPPVLNPMQAAQQRGSDNMVQSQVSLQGTDTAGKGNGSKKGNRAHKESSALILRL